MDPRTRPWPRHPVEGQLHRMAGAEGRPPQARGLAGEGAPEGDPEGTRVGAQQRQGRPLQGQGAPGADRGARSEEHTSELQSLMRISYAVFCLKKKKDKRK